MATNNLRQALKSSELTPEDLAELTGVDARTVRRWLSGKPPYPRHRAKIAKALQHTEQAIWPDLASSTEAQPRDLLTGYPTAHSVEVPSTETLIQAAQETIELLDYTLADYLRPDGLTELLIQKGRQAVQVRIMVARTTPQLAALLDQPGLELRVIEPDEHQAIHRYDDQMLTTLPLRGEADDPPPLLHIRRKGTGGLFDRFAAHCEGSWEHAVPLNSEVDLQIYLSQDDPGSDQSAEPEGLPTQVTQPAATPSMGSPVSAPRRWPRRPS